MTEDDWREVLRALFTLGHSDLALKLLAHLHRSVALSLPDVLQIAHNEGRGE